MTGEQALGQNRVDRWLLTSLGPLAVWLKTTWLLAISVGAAGIAIALIQWLARDEKGLLFD